MDVMRSYREILAVCLLAVTVSIQLAILSAEDDKPAVSAVESVNPVEGKKHRDKKHKDVEPTPAPPVEPEPDPLTDVKPEPIPPKPAPEKHKVKPHPQPGKTHDKVKPHEPKHPHVTPEPTVTPHKSGWHLWFWLKVVAVVLVVGLGVGAIVAFKGIGWVKGLFAGWFMR